MCLRIITDTDVLICFRNESLSESDLDIRMVYKPGVNSQNKIILFIGLVFFSRHTQEQSDKPVAEFDFPLHFKYVLACFVAVLGDIP